MPKPIVYTVPPAIRVTLDRLSAAERAALLAWVDSTLRQAAAPSEVAALSNPSGLKWAVGGGDVLPRKVP